MKYELTQSYYEDPIMYRFAIPLTDDQRMNAAAHEVGHMLMYMVAIALETDIDKFASECTNRISHLYISQYKDDDNSTGTISCVKSYKETNPNAYKLMLCGGPIADWCEELERIENQSIKKSLGYFNYAAKGGYYDDEQMRSLYKSCGGSSDFEHLLNLCTQTGTTVQEETVKTIHLFLYETFVTAWRELSLRLYKQHRFDNIDVYGIANEYKDVIYCIKDKEIEKEKERKRIEYLRNNSWSKRVWHRICKYVIRDNHKNEEEK